VPAPFPEALADPRVLGDGGALADPWVLGDGGALAVPLNTPEGVAGGFGPTLTEGELKIGGTDELLPVQAVTEAEKTSIAVAQPAAVSLALLTFMRPPYIPGGRRP
jgi:hypothetical protein